MRRVEAETTRQIQPLLFLAAADRRLYHPGNTLRELYAPADDLVDAAVGVCSAPCSHSQLTRTQFTIITAIASILLVGIVMKNAIMMVDFALDAERRLGLSAGARYSPRRAVCASARSS